MPQNRPAQNVNPTVPSGVSTGSTSATTKVPEPAVSSKVPEPVEGPTNKPTPQQSTIQPQAASVSTGSTSATTATSSAPVVRPRGATSSISINKAMQQAGQKAEEKEETWDTPFTQEQLTAAWADFVNRYKNVSPNFAAALGKYTPKLMGNTEIHFSVDNLLFEHDTEGMTALKHHLKNSLHNNQYQLKPELMERPAEIEAYTDKDKFEKMVEERPYLRTLQTELKLEGDL
jgi:hypothetical protein